MVIPNTHVDPSIEVLTNNNYEPNLVKAGADDQGDEPLINQYEQVMQLMHIEMTKLIEQNKQLKDSI